MGAGILSLPPYNRLEENRKVSQPRLGQSPYRKRILFICICQKNRW